MRSQVVIIGGGPAGQLLARLLECAGIDLIALDQDARRLTRVADNLTRLGLAATLVQGDAANSATTDQGGWWDGRQFDRILADVPCTASGIVRRHVDIKWLRREADIASFSAQQAKILANLWQMLAKGGKLLYVTCSVFNEENQQQVNQFLQQNANAIQLPFVLPAQYPQAGMVQMNGQLIPNNAHDGFFYALLQKN